MKFMLQALLISGLVSGAFAQGTQANQNQGTAKPDPKCKAGCEETARTERSACRAAFATCSLQVFDLLIEKLTPRYRACDSNTDSAVRSSCQLAAIGWATAETAAERQVCNSVKQTCLNDADDREGVCVQGCSSSSSSP